MKFKRKKVNQKKGHLLHPQKNKDQKSLKLNSDLFPSSIIFWAFTSNFSKPSGEFAEPTCTVFTTLLCSL